METYTFIALLCYFALMLAVGLYAYAKSGNGGPRPRSSISRCDY